jgi:hypothetical protein
MFQFVCLTCKLLYIQFVQNLRQSRLGTVLLCPINSSLRYNGSLDTWTVIRVTASKSESFVFSVPGFALLNIANIFIFMIFNGFGLLSA